MLLAGRASAQPAPQPVSILDVPFISQSEALCGGAAAAMVLRYWGERGLDAESFAHLVDRSAAGIRTTALVDDLRRRGWNITAIRGNDEIVSREIASGRPVLTLIEDRRGTYHYIVIVASLPRVLVFHDPARAPFRIMTREEFERRWEASDRWMAVIVPAAAPEALPPPSEIVLSGPSSCDALIASAIRDAQSSNLDGAERTLAAAMSCPGSAALRELAGVRLLQRRWPEVSDLAGAAVAQDPHDEYAWRLLATSRFVQNDPAGALDAWNRIGEPKVDLFAVDGLTRTRQRVVERLVAVESGTVLTPSSLVRARRRLRELPSSTSSRLEYVPVRSGLVELRATVAERSAVPSDAWSYAALGLIAAAQREVELTTGALAGGGERLTVAWRFWPERPRLGVALDAPAPWGGLWGVQGFAERQPFQSAALPPSKRVAARATLSNWVTSWMRAGVSLGMDRWEEEGAFAHAATSVRLVTHDDRAEATVDAGGWPGASGFGTVELAGTARSSTTRNGRVFVGRGGVSAATARTPADLWFGGDTGHARKVLLRAHPLLEDGALDLERMGRALAHASGEAQQWWRQPFGVRLGAAVFVDAVRADRRVAPGARGDVDAGVGARVALPVVPGVFRIDVAKGLRDGRTAVSFVYER